jgi:hypothetical protein
MATTDPDRVEMRRVLRPAAAAECCSRRAAWARPARPAVTFKHEVADGMHAAVVKARRPVGVRGT